MKRSILAILFLLSFVPISSQNKTLSNYGVKDRTVTPTVISNVVSNVPMSRAMSYQKLETLVPYIKKASKQFHIPENVIAAVLYEEILHRKPVDVKTFGVAQLGLNELITQGLPPKKELLNDDEVSVWLLASKLRRLQNETGSLRDAIILHNGYYDYYDSIRKTAKDPKVLTLLSQQQQSITILAEAMSAHLPRIQTTTIKHGMGLVSLVIFH